MQDFFKYIGEFGFTVFIAIYLLIRMEQKVENLTVSIQNLNKSIEKMKN